MQIRALTLLCVSFLLPSVASAQQHTARHTTAHSKATPTHSWFGTNLLKDGGFETETNSNGGVIVPGWKSAPGFNATDYGSVGSEWDTGLSGCPTCGQRYGRLVFEDPVKENSTTQTVNIAPAAADIDKGNITADLSAWLGGFKNDQVSNVLTISFQDASGKELGTLATDPVNTSKLPKPERGATSLVLAQKSGPVPSGTRSLVVTWILKSTGPTGSSIGLGDNLSVILSKPKA